MRPSLAALYKWRYPGLGDLPFIASRPEFGAANAGFVHDFQLVDVPDYGGVGESCPLPHFYQVRGGGVNESMPFCLEDKLVQSPAVPGEHLDWFALMYK